MTRAQAAFEAWARHTRSSWEWEYLDQPTRQAWELAAQAAVDCPPRLVAPEPRADGRVDRHG